MKALYSNHYLFFVERTMGATQVRPFRFKKFTIYQDRCAMKVGTDGVLLGAWSDVTGVSSALDIGAGCGVIAIMLGQRAEAARVDAVEIDRMAYEQALENAGRAPWADRLQVYHTSIQSFAESHGGHYDLIVSNPPFFTGGTFSSNQDRNSVRHTTKLPHGDLLAAARTLLTPRGRFCVVLPLIEGLRFQEMAASYHLYCNRMTEVKPRPGRPVERLLLQFGRSEGKLETDGLVIQEECSDEWTEAYKELTRAFYLKI